MKQNLLDKWIYNLESDKYRRGSGRLCYNNQYCCLGVLADIEGDLIIEKESYNGYITNPNGKSKYTCYLPNNKLEEYGMTYQQQSVLSKINDYTTDKDGFEDVVLAIKKIFIEKEPLQKVLNILKD